MELREVLTHKQLEMHQCVLSTVATDDLVLKHQAISIHSADSILNVLDPFQAEIYHIYRITLGHKITF